VKFPLKYKWNFTFNFKWKIVTLCLDFGYGQCENQQNRESRNFSEQHFNRNCDFSCAQLAFYIKSIQSLSDKSFYDILWYLDDSKNLWSCPLKGWFFENSTIFLLLFTLAIDVNPFKLLNQNSETWLISNKIIKTSTVSI
jgi:hypothetical protein